KFYLFSPILPSPFYLPLSPSPHPTLTPVLPNIAQRSCLLSVSRRTNMFSFGITFLFRLSRIMNYRLNVHCLWLESTYEAFIRRWIEMETEPTLEHWTELPRSR
ncbi:hypothetical protein LEMLEM_LOCUS4331, partial [Lemmus lemmus]